MKTQQVFVQAFIYENKYREEGYSIVFDATKESYDPDRCPSGWVFLAEMEIDMPLPDFDAREKLLELAVGELKELMAKYAREKATIEDKISKLTALEVIDGD